MDPLPIGCLEEKAPNGCAKYALILLKEKYNKVEDILRHLFPVYMTCDNMERVTLFESSQLAIVMEEHNRLQSSELPHTGIIGMEGGMHFVEGEIVALSSEELEMQWFEEFKTALETSEQDGNKYLHDLAISTLLSSENNVVALLHSVNRWLQDLVKDDSKQQLSSHQHWNNIGKKMVPVILEIIGLQNVLFASLQLSDILKSSGSDSLSDWRNLLHQKLDFHHYFDISVQCPRSVEEAYKEIIEQLVSMLQAHKRLYLSPGVLQVLAAKFPSYEKSEELQIEVMRRAVIVVEVVEYVERSIMKAIRADGIIEHSGNTEKYLSFEEKNVDIVVIPYLAHYPRILYDHFFQLVDSNALALLFELFLRLARYEPSLIYTAALEPDLPQVDELQKQKDEWCWEYMKETNEENWKRYYKMRQNYFCLLLQYNDVNLEKRVVLGPPKDCSEVLDGSIDPNIRVEVFIDDLNNPDISIISLIRKSKNYTESGPKELSREVLLTWSEDYSTSYIKELLVNDKDGLNSLLGLINYSTKYLQAFLEIIIEEEPARTREQQIFHSGCSWALLILIKKYLPDVFIDCPFFKEKFKKFFSAMTMTVNSLLSYGVVEVYINEFKLQFNETLVEEKNHDVWRASVVQLEKELEARYKAEWLFNDFFDTDDEQKYEKEKKQSFTKTVKKFAHVMFLVFIQKISYFFVKKKMHPIADRTIDRMKQLLNQVPYLRKKFYYEDFQQILRNLLYGDWFSGKDIINRVDIPVKYSNLSLLFIKTWPELFAEELIGNTIVGRFDVAIIDVVKTLHHSKTSSVQVVILPNYVSHVVAKRFLHGDIDNNVSEILEKLMTRQSHPHVVHFYGYLVEDNDYVGTVMEYCSGGTLEEAIEENYYYYARMIEFWSDAACMGLGFLHRNGIVHGNLNPKKLFFPCRHRETIKIGGFRGSIKRNSDFVAPEIRDGQSATKASDVYSLGKLIEYMIRNEPAKKQQPAASIGRRSRSSVDEFNEIYRRSASAMHKTVRDDFVEMYKNMIDENPENRIILVDSEDLDD